MTVLMPAMVVLILSTSSAGRRDGHFRTCRMLSLSLVPVCVYAAAAAVRKLMNDCSGVIFLFSSTTSYDFLLQFLTSSTQQGQPAVQLLLSFVIVDFRGTCLCVVLFLLVLVFFVLFRFHYFSSTEHPVLPLNDSVTDGTFTN